ncbi:protein windpipe [Cydia fagiglandana]|uniref:protein windpipe n=1 Tax=Cydia fagiglandana TaxID=1458189 RepID=UPI002FEDF322
MSTLRAWASLLVVSVLLAPVLSSVCPDGCICTTTRDGLHRAACSNLAELYKFTLRQKHHNINILDLSHNNITKISRELDRLTEVVTLDLSTNGITEVSKFLNNAKKLVHLNLANNRIERLSLEHLPTSVSSLDLTNNLLRDVPNKVGHLASLEHLELDGNPLDCTCDNIKARDRLLALNVHIDAVKCASPGKLKGRSWLELKAKDICKIKIDTDPLDMMMGDQPPVDAVRIGEETTELKSMPLVASSDLDDGNVIHGQPQAEDDDNQQFLKVGHMSTVSHSDYIGTEGSGDVETATDSEIIMHKHAEDLNAEIQTTDDPREGSGEGSGFIPFDSDYDNESTSTSTGTPNYEDFHPTPVTPLFNDEFNNTTTEFPLVKPPTLYAGGSDWHLKTDEPSTEKPAITPITRDTTVSEQIRITPAEVQETSSEENPAPHKTGTYVCIAIIVILLVGLIGFAIIKGQMRKRRDRRLLRQQKRDVENASKEMVDMNKSLLGKPAVLEPTIERKVNGKYELVPTHESYPKKSENGDIGNGIKHGDNNGVRTDSPRDTNQNKSSSKDNNLSEEPKQNESFQSTPASPDSKKDTHSLSSEDVFVPINDNEAPHLNGNTDMDLSQLLLNGDQNTESDFLSPSREYVPVYSPDMGRVRIKMTETPKPKTPVLVTRSRSNAGDIIITPSLDDSTRKSTT